MQRSGADGALGDDQQNVHILKAPHCVLADHRRTSLRYICSITVVQPVSLVIRRILPRRPRHCGGGDVFRGFNRRWSAIKRRRLAEFNAEDWEDCTKIENAGMTFLGRRRIPRMYNLYILKSLRFSGKMCGKIGVR